MIPGRQIICFKCNTKLEPEEKFCPNCGTKAEESFLLNRDPIDILDIPNKIKFYLAIVKNGAFQSDLYSALLPAPKDSIEAYAIGEQYKGFLTIKDQENPHNHQLEKFYFLSEENFNFIIFRICHGIKYHLKQEIYQELLFYKNNLLIPSIEEITMYLGKDNRINSKHKLLLEENSEYLLFYILKTSQTIKQQKNLNRFIIDVIVRMIDLENYTGIDYTMYKEMKNLS